MKNKRVAVAMSGGVDSSIAALLLKKQGFSPVGFFMKLHHESVQAEKDARNMAKILDIPFYVLNFSNFFKKNIIDYFVKSYQNGQTPNPCIICNEKIKFGELFKAAKKLACQYFATGHYAICKNGKLYASLDQKKDQSYFLYRLPENILKNIIFPCGTYTKDKIKAIAKKNKLPVYEKKESQDICFINQKNYSDFLKKYIKAKPGKIIDQHNNKVFGQHSGLYKYTIGQRQGLNIKNGFGPYFVVNKNIKKNSLIISNQEEDLYKNILYLKNIHWINQPKKFPIKAKVKIRYSQQVSPAQVYKNKIIFHKKIRAITPGQHAVVYRGGEVLGGGEII